VRTFSQTKEDAIASRKWLHVDAEGMPVGRLASQVANFLRGKHKPTFTRHVDGGDYVIVTNAAKLVLTGAKGGRTVRVFHSGYIGGKKEILAGDFLAKNPRQALLLAVKRMLPPGPLGRAMLTKLKVYVDDKHPHAVQSPETITFAKRSAKKAAA
jgi:large subunit ribosomal protein L13